VVDSLLEESTAYILQHAARRTAEEKSTHDLWNEWMLRFIQPMEATWTNRGMKRLQLLLSVFNALTCLNEEAVRAILNWDGRMTTLLQSMPQQQNSYLQKLYEAVQTAAVGSHHASNALDLVLNKFWKSKANGQDGGYGVVSSSSNNANKRGRNSVPISYKASENFNSYAKLYSADQLSTAAAGKNVLIEVLAEEFNQLYKQRTSGDDIPIICGHFMMRKHQMFTATLLWKIYCEL